MPSPEPQDTFPVGGALFVTAAAAVFLYTLIIAQQLLVGAAIVGVLFVVYLLWRLVRAQERIAAALEDDCSESAE